jgi:hypothetical protein
MRHYTVICRKMGLFEGNAPPYAAPYAALYAGNLAEPYSPMDKLPKQDVGRGPF